MPHELGLEYVQWSPRLPASTMRMVRGAPAQSDVLNAVSTSAEIQREGSGLQSSAQHPHECSVSNRLNTNGNTSRTMPHPSRRISMYESSNMLSNSSARKWGESLSGAHGRVCFQQGITHLIHCFRCLVVLSHAPLAWGLLLPPGRKNSRHYNIGTCRHGELEYG